MTSNSSCSDARLRALLAVGEDSRELLSASKHVDVCAHCQRRLAELAGSEREWREAHDYLDSVSRIGTGEGDESRSASRWNVHLAEVRPPVLTEPMLEQLLSPPSHPEMLGRIGRYEVERLIGSGGMGIVFKAFDTELNRPVAIKILAPYLTVSGAARQRFAREARAAAAIVHEHVVAIHNVETNEKSPYLVMQYVAGESLQARLDRDGPLEVCEILRIAMQTAAALSAAHAQGLVHRDVKPSNILLEKGIERTLLTDFGLARANDDASLTRTGFHPGTPQYMSPEQARGDAVDTRSDLFSLGSVMYTMCTGRPPFRAETGYGILRRITDTEPRPIREINPDVPLWLAGIVVKLHAKDAEQRFASAGEVRDVLEQCLAHIQQPTTTALPAACAHWSRTGERWYGIPSRLDRLLSLTQRPKATHRLLLNGLLTTSMGVACLVAGSSLGPWPFSERPDENGPDRREGSSVLPAHEFQSSDDLGAAGQWNPLEQPMERWSAEWHSFERRAGKLWDADPTSLNPPDIQDTFDPIPRP